MVEWITTTEAAELAGCTTREIRQWIQAKKVVAEKKGGHFWINRSSLLRMKSSMTSSVLPTPTSTNIPAELVPEKELTASKGTKIALPVRPSGVADSDGIDYASAYRTLIHAYLRIHANDHKTKSAESASTS